MDCGQHVLVIRVVVRDQGRTPETRELRDTLRDLDAPEECPDMAKQTSEAAAREIHRRTRRKFSPEEKIRIVLEGPLGEESAAELCRRKGIAANLYYRWSNDFHEAGGSPDA